VNTKWRPCEHPDEKLFEDYSFDRLSEQETSIFEEHVLSCKECQNTLAFTEDYIGLMKGATAAYEAYGGERQSGVPLRALNPGTSRLNQWSMRSAARE
jgi:hypothetical protein